jgi:hypothetical protein
MPQHSLINVQHLPLEIKPMGWELGMLPIIQILVTLLCLTGYMETQQLLNII